MIEYFLLRYTEMYHAFPLTQGPSSTSFIPLYTEDRLYLDIYKQRYVNGDPPT